MIRITLPNYDGRLESFEIGPPKKFPNIANSRFNRTAYAAVHIVANPLADIDPWSDTAIDWDATISYRRHIFGLGLGVAEAMDTAQRGMGLNWPVSQELIRLSLSEARNIPGAKIACGAGTDHIVPSPDITIWDVIRAYEDQIEFIEKEGGKIILMGSRALAACAKSPDDYAYVYGRILSQTRQPVILHWLGEMFDPSLSGYWGYKDQLAAMRICIDIIGDNSEKVDGIKISLLDKSKEIDMRRQLPVGVKMYSGDDFNFAELIAGDNFGYSDALLGIFDPIAPAASAALAAMAGGDVAEFYRILDPIMPLSRHIFCAPTQFYKTGIVFIAWLNGYQDHFVMVGGQESARSLLHLTQLFRLAAVAGVLKDPDLSAFRMRQILTVYGLDNSPR